MDRDLIRSLQKIFLRWPYECIRLQIFRRYGDKYTDYLIESNPDEFAQVGFIGKGGVHNVHEKR